VNVVTHDFVRPRNISRPDGHLLTDAMTENSNGHAVIDYHSGHFSDARGMGALDTFDRAALTPNFSRETCRTPRQDNISRLCSTPVTGD
jgi:hypothetical protein